MSGQQQDPFPGLSLRRDDPPPHSPVTLPEIIDTLQAVANSIRATADNAVIAGFRVKPDPKLLRQVEVLDAASKVLSVVLPYWDAVKETIRRKRDGYAPGRSPFAR